MIGILLKSFDVPGCEYLKAIVVVQGLKYLEFDFDIILFFTIPEFPWLFNIFPSEFSVNIDLLSLAVILFSIFSLEHKSFSVSVKINIF